MNNDLRFSILIPAYKSKYLQEAITSCLKQTYDNFEIIVVNDASPENLDSIVNEIKDCRLKYFVNSQGCGAENVVDNWNICLSYSEGQYVICMGDDDKLMPNCLEEYQKLIIKYPNLGIYHAWTIIINEKGLPFSMQHARPEWEGPASFAWHRWNGRNKQFIGDFCFDAAKLKAEGGFYKLPLAWGSDDVTAVRAARIYGIANTPVPCFLYRENQNTITRSGNYEKKLLSSLQEKDWYIQNIDLLKEHIIIPNSINQYMNSIIQVESMYHKMLKDELRSHFETKIEKYLFLILKNRPLSFLYWLQRAKNIGLSRKKIFKCWLSSVFSF